MMSRIRNSCVIMVHHRCVSMLEDLLHISVWRLACIYELGPIQSLSWHAIAMLFFALKFICSLCISLYAFLASDRPDCSHQLCAAHGSGLKDLFVFRSILSCFAIASVMQVGTR